MDEERDEELLSPIDLEEEITEEDELEGLEDIELAVVTAVGSGGVKIRIDGDEEAGDKYYKVNRGALFAVGDRVKINKNSGTYIIEYAVGAPMSRYPIPSGGSDGQVLMKDGNNGYAVKWATLAIHNIPSGGSAGQMLVKDTAANYDVKWANTPTGIPTGGTDGQVLTKNGSSNYSVKWANVTVEHELPTGGTDGQVLTKNGTSNYSVKWANVPESTVSKLTSGSYTVTFSGSALYPSGTCALGTNSYYFNGCYLKGSMRFGDSSYTPNAVGFFGVTPQSRKRVTTSATLSDVISALQSYGLFSSY